MWDRVFWIGLSCLSVFYLVPGFIGWPGLHIDSYYFSTPVISAAKGEGWLFGGFTHLLALYPDRVYRGHGFIHIFVFGELLRCSTWRLFLFWCAVVNAMSCVVWGLGCLRQLNLSSRRLEVVAALAAANIGGLAGLALQGRPEHLAVVVSGILLLVVQTVGRSLLADIAVAFATAILFCMSPALGALMACGVAIFCGIYWFHEARILRLARFVLIGVGAMLVSVTLVYLAGFNIQSWLGSNMSGFAVYYPFYMIFRFVKFWSGYTNFYFPLWNVLFCTGASGIIVELIKKRCWWVIVWLFVSSVKLTPFLLDYSYLAFLPGLFVLLMRYGHSQSSTSLGIQKMLVYACFASVVVVYSLTVVRILVLLGLYECSGVTFEQAHKEVQGLRSQVASDQDLIAFSSRRNASPIVLDDPSSVYLQTESTRTPGPSYMSEVERIETLKGKKIRFFLYSQTFRGSPPEEVYLGHISFKLDRHNWISQRTKFLGVPLGGPFPGYQFAIYYRNEVKAAQN